MGSSNPSVVLTRRRCLSRNKMVVGFQCSNWMDFLNMWWHERLFILQWEWKLCFFITLTFLLVTSLLLSLSMIFWKFSPATKPQIISSPIQERPTSDISPSKNFLPFFQIKQMDHMNIRSISKKKCSYPRWEVHVLTKAWKK